MPDERVRMNQVRIPEGWRAIGDFLRLRRLDPRGSLSHDARGNPCVSLVSAARIAGVDPGTIRNAIRAGRLPATLAAGSAKNRPWLVPLLAAERFRPLPPGRPPKRMEPRKHTSPWRYPWCA